jgi:glycosyltransferase involved in cell wall biosynthesis
MRITKRRKSGVSVIIPTFNRASYLYTTLLLLLNQQTGGNLQYEILVIDSGSDDTDKVIDFFSSQRPGIITYRRIKNCRNRSLLRNTGAALSQYDVFIFLDNDILVPPDFIRTHYDRQKETGHLVLLGRRRSLTSFSIRDIGEEALCTDFSLLEKLPWYEDERIYETFDGQLWRYAFSHSMSLHADDFFAAGKFNAVFGEHWGFEDLELGFKLMNTGCTFVFLKEPCMYHQPHFSQSYAEQHEQRPNQELFVKMHNCFAGELYISFCSLFNTLYPVLNSIPFVQPDSRVTKKYDLILCCLFSSASPEKTDKMFLGTYIPKRSGSCRNVLVLKTFYRLPHEVQTAVIAESFRVSSHVCFEEYSEVHKQIVLSVCRETGFSVTDCTKKDILSTVLQKVTPSHFYSFVLPDVLTPEKRYIYTWFAYRLSENGCMVTVQDMKNVKAFDGNDFSLPDRMISVVSDLTNRCYGFIHGQSVYSSAMLQSEKMITVQDIPDNYIIHDEDFIFNYKSLESRGHTHCIHLNESCYEHLSFASIYDTFCMYERKKQEIPENDDSFCCFMENGYLEDGIDILLKAFYLYKTNSPSARLSIKMPDYGKLFNCCYPLHNDASRKAKTFGIRQKINFDLSRLNNAVAEYNLEGSVAVIRQNMTINEIFDLIDSHATVVNPSRGCCTPPQIYAALLLQKKIIAAQHQHLMQPFSDYCIIVKSKLYPLAEELQVPLICENAAYSAGRINGKDLCSAFAEKKGKTMTPEKAEETACLFNPEIVFRQAD